MDLGLEKEKTSLENELLTVETVETVDKYPQFQQVNDFHNFNKNKYFNKIQIISNNPNIDYVLVCLKEKTLSLKDLFEDYSNNIESIEYKTFQMRISRIDSKTSLISLGYVKAEKGLYSITKEGIEYLDSLLKEYDFKQQQEYVRRKAEEQKEKEAVFRVQFFKNLFDEYYKAELFNSLNNKKFLEIDFNKVLEKNPDVAMGILEEPKEYYQAIQIAINQIDEEYSKIPFTFKNLPNSCSKRISSITHSDEGKLIKAKGIISSAGIPSPNCSEIIFECTSCGTLAKKRQLEKSIIPIKKCSNCGYKGNFTELKKEYKTIQILKLEEHGEDIGDKAMPSSIHLILEEHLTNSEYQPLYNAGSNIEVSGIVSIEQPDKKKTNAFLVIDCLNVKSDDAKINLVISDLEEASLTHKKQIARLMTLIDSQQKQITSLN